MAHQPLTIVRTVAALRATVKAWRADGLRVGLVPTMGALHEGHLSLVRLAQTMTDRVVVSVFVNPKQFGVNEDFATYPRQEAADAAKLESVAASILYAPTPSEIYPSGFATTVSVAGVSAGLCGGERPGHFDGVATVVTKLLLQTLPDVAVFGEKDYQQLAVIRRLTTDLDIPVTIVGGPTLREADGLALSSRNAYLSAAERAVAAALPRVLKGIVTALENGDAPASLLTDGVAALRAAGFASVDYLELRDALTLEPVTTLQHPARLIAAARLGTTRLIDNWPVKATPAP